MGPSTARLFDAMAEDYDVLEPWYEHFYAVLHAILVDALVPAGRLPESFGIPAAGPSITAGRALDAGCGNGFQTALLAQLGYRTHGLDIASRLLATAQHRLPSAILALASVQSLPYRDDSFETIACCGSTLSLVDDPIASLGELARVLKPGGRLLLDCEHRPSLDLAWALVSSLWGDWLDYGLSARDAWRQLARRPREGHTVTYPGYGQLRLFGRREMASMLVAAGLQPLRWWSIHTVTNLIPSTILHRQHLGRLLAVAYNRLRTLDARLSTSSLTSRLANTVVVLAGKPPRPGGRSAPR